MTPERWQQTRQILHEALQREPERRAVFLADSCAGDDVLRREVEALLVAHQQAGSFLVNPVVLPELTPASIHLSPGTRVGLYEVRALLGAGGMGEVYRARDTRLGRDVAMKILPSAFIGDADRLDRFEREARVLATLNHPHIGAIYGIEDAPTSGGVP